MYLGTMGIQTEKYNMTVSLHKKKYNKRKKRKPKRLRTIAIIPSLVTLLNGVFGFAAIHFAARGMNEPNRIWLEKPAELTFFAAAAWMIFMAMIADSLDGFLARRAGSASDFGGQLDSLCDVISFGVAPAFLVLRVVESGLQETATPIFGSFWGRLLWLVAAMYVCCTALRLARFNVENTTDESSHQTFSGLPSPAAAAVIASLVLLYSDFAPALVKNVPVSSYTHIFALIILYCLPFISVALALLMVSRIPYIHIVNQYIRGRKPFYYLVVVVIIFLLLLWKPQLTIAVGSLVFMFSGPWQQQFRKFKNPQNKRPLSPAVSDEDRAACPPKKIN